jgi:signal transduction histidine kinase
MTRQVEMTPDLATLLERHREEIATAWAEIASQLPDSHYRERPLEERRASAMRGLGAIVEALTTGSYAALETYLTDVSLTRVRMDFHISEVIEALLLLKNVAQPLIWRATPSGSAVAQKSITRLDACLRWTVARFGQLYAAEMSRHLREQQNRTALMLEMAQTASSSLDLDEVLRHVARGIATAAGVRHCGFYLMDEEQGLFIPRLGTDTLPTLTATQAFLNRPLDPNTTHVFIRQVLDRKEPLTSYDAQTDPRMDKETARLLGVKSTLAVPFVVKDRVLAVAVVGTFDDYHTFTKEQIELAWGIANAVALAIENASLYEETHRRLAESQSLQRVTAALLQKLSLKEVLEIVCTEAQRLTGAMACNVLLLEDGEWLRVALSSGAPSPPFERIPVEGSFAGTAVRKGEFFLTNDPASDEQVYRREDELTALLTVPLKVKGAAIGALSVVNKPEGFTEEDVRIISLFADQAAIAIENARLYQQVRHLAVLEERDRLGRELHDRLAQALGNLNLKASITGELLSGGQIAQAQASLLELKEMTGETYTDTREAIFNLRTPASLELGLLPTLREYLTEYRAHYSVDVRLVADNESLPEFPADVKIQIIRIIQEALTNVRKHAGANKAWVRFQQQGGDWICISVEDDGRGFDPARATAEGRQYFGLQIMRERAGSVGGDLVLDSRLGQGTRVVIRVPFTRGD